MIEWISLSTFNASPTPSMNLRTSLSRLLAAAALAHLPAPAAPSYPDLLLVHFTSDTANGEQIYFATSEDGYRFTDLNGSRPVLVSNVGDKGVRDPSIIRSAKGDKFYILATDLRMANGRGWDAAMHHASTAIVIWESSDLVNWSAPRLVDIAGAIPQAGCAWAPEAIYDEESGDYIVFWTTISPAGGVDKPRIYYSRTRDFATFTPAQLYIDRPGPAGLIDTQIVKIDDPTAPYRYVRASGDGQLTLEGSQSILGDWTVLGDLRPIGLTGKDVEGPILFKLPQPGQWALWVDQYRTRGGYLALETGDLAHPETFKRADPARVAYGASKKRHGSVLNISAEEYRRLLAKWPAAPATAKR
jgi:sucrose-6-phosphate hydrolase SacC (GH32 family)